MIGQNKVLRARLKGEEHHTCGFKYLYRFYFIFTDGLYYWDYNDNEYTIRKGGRTDRGQNEIKDYCFIKHEHLKLLTTEVKSVSQITNNAHSTSEIIID